MFIRHIQCYTWVFAASVVYNDFDYFVCVYLNTFCVLIVWERKHNTFTLYFVQKLLSLSLTSEDTLDNSNPNGTIQPLIKSNNSCSLSIALENVTWKSLVILFIETDIYIQMMQYTLVDWLVFSNHEYWWLCGIQSLFSAEIWEIMLWNSSKQTDIKYRNKRFRWGHIFIA